MMSVKSANDAISPLIKGQLGCHKGMEADSDGSHLEDGENITTRFLTKPGTE